MATTTDQKCIQHDFNTANNIKRFSQEFSDDVLWRNVTHIIMNGRLFAWLDGVFIRLVAVLFKLFLHCISNSSLAVALMAFLREKEQQQRHFSTWLLFNLFASVLKHSPTNIKKIKNKRKICWFFVCILYRCCQSAGKTLDRQP